MTGDGSTCTATSWVEWWAGGSRAPGTGRPADSLRPGARRQRSSSWRGGDQRPGAVAAPVVRRHAERTGVRRAIRREVNEAYAGLIKEYPGCFGAFARPMDTPDHALAEIEYALDTLGLDACY